MCMSHPIVIYVSVAFYSFSLDSLDVLNNSVGSRVVFFRLFRQYEKPEYTMYCAIEGNISGRIV